MQIKIPHNYEPRFYQLPFFRAMDSGINRACLIWHRRSGKTKTLLNFAVKKSFERVGTIFHCFPEYGQARKVIWDGIDLKNQCRLIDSHIPEEIRKKTNSTEMKIEFLNGSQYQLIGADNYNSVMGANPVGFILDEYSVSDRYKSAWDYFRPILAENGGWAVFPFTPRGRTHGWDLYQMALGNDNWFCQLLTVDDTKAITNADVQAEREAGMSEDMIQQEFYSSFIASTENILIPFEWIQKARKTQSEYLRSGRIAGYDAARFGDDRNALTIRQAGQIIYIETWGGQDTVQSAGRIIQAYRNKFFDCVAMDTIGLGSGIYDMVKNADVPCVSVNVAESSTDDSRFSRMRDEVWWKCREWFMSGASISSGIPDPLVDALIKDIQDIQFEYNAKGQIKVESKDDFKKRMRDKGSAFSPDIGDSLCCTFSPLVEMKIKQQDQSMFGDISGPGFFKKEYDPLTFGLVA